MPILDIIKQKNWYNKWYLHTYRPSPMGLLKTPYRKVQILENSCQNFLDPSKNLDENVRNLKGSLYGR